MKHNIIERSIIEAIKEETGIIDPGSASIREIVRLVNVIEERTGQQFIRMEMGVPGLEASLIGVNAEIEALQKGVASKYPMIEGVKDLKVETSRFIKLFLDIDIKEDYCIPTVGSLMGSMAAFMVVNRTDKKKCKTLFLDPGFPVHKQQCDVLGQKYEAFDVYNYRGKALRNKLESYLKSGEISSILYSNPNNPSWICFTNEELKIIGDLAEKYDLIVLEDLAYFGMDFRQDYSTPGKEPFQPSVAKYCNNYILLISGSKSFSYAGQRVGVMAVSGNVFNRAYPDLKRYFSSDIFGHALIYGALYALSAGTCHSAQYALAAMFKAANEGDNNFIRDLEEYGEKAAIMKKLFTTYGFKLVYDTDLEKPIADGFYFTLSYPGFSGSELISELIYYGISAISLDLTGSERKEGLRACVSMVRKSQFPDLELRLKNFQKDHPVN